MSHSNKSASDFYEERNYAEAVRLLTEQDVVHRSDVDKSLLATCYYYLQQYNELVEVVKTMESPAEDDLEMAGVAALRLDQYDTAKEFLVRANSKSQHPQTSYLLALALRGGDWDHNMDSETRANVVKLLESASALPRCPLAALLWLESLQRYDPEDIVKRISLLQKAIEAYPKAEEPVIRLAGWYTYRLGVPDQALAVLQPFMSRNSSNPQIWMKAYCAAKEVGNYSAALDYLERVQVSDKPSHISVKLLKADAAFELKRYEHALVLYTEVLNGDLLHQKIVGFFGRARTHLQIGKRDEAEMDADRGTQLFLNNDAYLTRYDPIFIDGEDYGYDFIHHIKEIARYYLQKDIELTPEFRGGLCYLFHEVGLEDSDDNNFDADDLVLRAHELSSHARISRGLAGVFARQGEWSKAVKHHFEYCLWSHNKGFAVQDDSFFLSEAEDNKSTIKKAERTKIAKIARDYAARHKEDGQVLGRIIKPFYIQFWRELLIKDGLSETIVDISAAILTADSNETNANITVMWDNAYHLAQLGRNKEAEVSYKSLLRIQPDNAAALHNLSILLEKNGDFLGALEMSGVATSLAPNDQLISSRTQQLREQARKVQIQRAASTRTDKKLQSVQSEAKTTTRKGITKKLRFEVFKRDSFTCQYCGRKSPDVILQADHIDPVSKGGANDILNLITSCTDCNAGKSDRKLSDHSILEKRRRQLEELQERKEQIEMMLQWQKELGDLNAQTVDQVTDLWSDLVHPFTLTPNGKSKLKKLLRQFGLDEIMDAMRVAVEQYVEYEGDTPTSESVEKAWSKIGGICRVKKEEQEKPYMRDLYYIRGILRNRLSYTKDWLALQMLEESVLQGVSIPELRRMALEARSWTQWTEMMQQTYQET